MIIIDITCGALTAACLWNIIRSGSTPGHEFAWMRREQNPDKTLLVWYGEETEYHLCPILFREVLEL